jgi:hypothetical protein
MLRPASTPDLAQRLSVVIDAYRRRFSQQFVGVITRVILPRFGGHRC